METWTFFDVALASFCGQIAVLAVYGAARAIMAIYAMVQEIRDTIIIRRLTACGKVIPK